MIDIATLRRRIGQEFDDACHLSAEEARCLFDVYEAACTWRDDRGEIAGALLTRDPRHGHYAVHADKADDRLIAAVDAVRSVP